MSLSRVGPTIDLVYDAECPNVDDARAILRVALAQAGLPEAWREWDREGASTPAALRGLGSPTILVNGVDVSGLEANVLDDRANCCRVYHHDGRLRGVPAFSVIATAISRETAST